ncbi:response regulator transcription factor [Rhodocytophaga aerolata]|uniref:Response regulator transcription factor n=1 Tax=Rhodocytophaga aerolata TaxID=455078 RepID=A0ABT8RF97_9BACT|nr:response regulator transcription factor [Rhodocytophaga aerolata]MDO1449858.1 response regulator transcription factor [Rhodocytophaga aerolata]
MKILIVEDEKEVATFIKNGLEDYGIEATIALDAVAAQQMMMQTPYTTVIIDVNLPKINGFELCKIIRERYGDLPVLMLTAMGTTENKLSGFAAGADDYLVKPFEFRELMARLRVLNKRRYGPPPEIPILRIADLELNVNSKTVKRSNQVIELTAREIALLELFMRNQDKALTRNEILDKVWDLSFDTGTNVVDVYINYLRKKIDKDFSPKLIHTITGIGYIMKMYEE